jgi:hypothetical protein
VTFTATGSDDVCRNPDRYSDSGWATKPLDFRVNYKTRQHVVYPSACNNPRYRPRRVVIACGDRSFYVDHVRWTTWTDHGARGAGTAHVNDCRPTCAGGHFHSYRGVTVRLAFPRFCQAHNDYEFTGLQYHFSRARPAGLPRTGLGPRGCAPARRTAVDLRTKGP